MIDYAKLLAQGVGGWLQFEHACGRSGLFSEKYLCHAIGQILSGRSNNRTLAEYKHPVLAPLAKGSGRKPALDFAVCENYPEVSIAVESKWVGRSTAAVESILWDLIRLELVAAHTTKARCFFVLGGTRNRLDELFATEAFSEKGVTHSRNPVLLHDRGGLHKTKIAEVSQVRAPILKRAFKEYQNQEFPTVIASRRTLPFPPDQEPKAYQIYVWEISAMPGRQVFFPVNSFQLRRVGATRTAPKIQQARP